MTDRDPVRLFAPNARDAGEEILRAAARLQEALAESAESVGLTVLQARLLRTVLDEVPQRELARVLAVDPARISVLTADLEARGLVVRVPSDNDRRQRVTTLTEEGYEALERVGTRLVAATPLNRLAHHERDQLINLLRRITAAD